MNSLSLLIQSLQNPALFSHPIISFKIIETHISWLLLTGYFVYKIKKPVNLGFLDFSSLEKRRHFCFEEIRLNSRLAPEIYLDVVAIRGSERQPKFDSHGTIIEYAVKMRQFDPTSTFDHLVACNQLSREQIKQTAEIIANFHANSKPVAGHEPFGNADIIMQPVRENFSQIQLVSQLDHTELLAQLALWCEQQYLELRPVFQQRKNNGFIRECHGDLHLGNIALIHGRAVPFDGIEFNPALYWIDVINDIAFLSMDLEEKHRDDLAFQFVNEYLQYSGDYEGLKLMRFYQLYRALVRAKVNAIRLTQSDSTTAIANYHSYLQLASRMTQTPASLLIIMHGLSGSGKSWLSEQVIIRYPIIRIRSDVERKRLFQKSHQPQNSINTGLYNPKKSQLTYQRLLQLSETIIVAGYSVIVDATFLHQEQRSLFSQLAKQLSIPFLIIHMQADKPILAGRIQERAARTGDVSDADQSVMEYQSQTEEALTDDERLHSISIDTRRTEHLTRLWRRLERLCAVKDALL